MATNFTMPQLGMTMEEGDVIRWYKSVGESVKAGEPLVEVSTDKITNELESPVDGVVLQIAVPEGQSARVNALLAVIGQSGEQIEARDNKVEKAEVPAEVIPEATPVKPVQAVTREDGRILASPAAKRLAKEIGVDITAVIGSGPNGRVVERDVLRYQEEEKELKMSPLAAKLASEHGITSAELSKIGKESRIMKADVAAMISEAAPAADQTSPAGDPDKKGIPLAGMRKVISERMVSSWQTYPHVSVEVEVDMSEAKALRSKLTEASGTKYSFTEIIVKACAVALMEYKAINSSLVNNVIYEHDSANIGLAVAIDNGLIVPVIKDAQNKSISALRKEIGELTEKAKKGGLERDQITGGTFTISNMGMYGLTRFTSIINAPETAILGTASIIDRPVVINGEITVRPIMNIILTFDHRVLDGAMGANFAGRIRQLLEQPYLLF